MLTSSDATNWIQESSPTTHNLNTVAAFNNTLFAAGESGIVISKNDAGVWVRRPAPTGELLLASASSDRAAIIVGGSGTILRATPTPLAPKITLQPASVTETLRGAASFVVRVRGSLPFSYQWFRNGTPLTGETRPELIRAPLARDDAGSYTVRITSPAGTSVSLPAILTLLPEPAAIVDATFRADTVLSGLPSALLPLPDGSLLVANGRPGQLLKLRADGALDPSWASNNFLTAEGGPGGGRLV